MRGSFVRSLRALPGRLQASGDEEAALCPTIDVGGTLQLPPPHHVACCCAARSFQGYLKPRVGNNPFQLSMMPLVCMVSKIWQLHVGRAITSPSLLCCCRLPGGPGCHHGIAHPAPATAPAATHPLAAGAAAQLGARRAAAAGLCCPAAAGRGRAAGPAPGLAAQPPLCARHRRRQQRHAHVRVHLARRAGRARAGGRALDRCAACGAAPRAAQQARVPACGDGARAGPIRG